MSNWEFAAKLADLEIGKVISVDTSAGEIALANTNEGIFAILDKCSHADVALSEGELNDCKLECWMHGSAFNLKTGIPDGPPAVHPVPVFNVRVVGDDADAIVEIEVG